MHRVYTGRDEGNGVLLGGVRSVYREEPKHINT